MNKTILASILFASAFGIDIDGKKVGL
jgi:hypothetical protein